MIAENEFSEDSELPSPRRRPDKLCKRITLEGDHILKITILGGLMITRRILKNTYKLYCNNQYLY